MSFKKWLVLSVALLLPIAAYANTQNVNPLQPYLNIIAPNVIDGVTVNPSTPSPVFASGLTVSGTEQDSGVIFSTNMFGNPSEKVNFVQLSSMGQLNTGFVLIASTAGRTIYPGAGSYIMASGTPATCTSITLYCEPSGRKIVTTTVGGLQSLVPAGTMSSGSTMASGLGEGCLAGDAVLASQAGGICTTVTALFFELVHTIQ
jgi:hypothetical protein